MALVELNNSVAVGIIDYVRHDLRMLPSVEKSVTVIKHNEDYFCIYITKGLYFKLRLYCAKLILLLENDNLELIKTFKDNKFVIDPDLKGKVAIYETKYEKEYSALKTPDVNNPLQLLEGFS